MISRSAGGAGRRKSLARVEPTTGRPWRRLLPGRGGEWTDGQGAANEGAASVEGALGRPEGHPLGDDGAVSAGGGGKRASRGEGGRGSQVEPEILQMMALQSSPRNSPGAAGRSFVFACF